METGSVYKITNTINGKIYIGITCRPVEQRVKEHFRNSEELLAKDAYKFGFNAFSVETLNDNIPDEFLEQLEDFYIKHFNSLIPNGYNVRTTSDESEEQRKYCKRKQMEGIENYKAKHGGKGAGRPKTDADTMDAAIAMYLDYKPVSKITSLLGVSSPTLYREMKRRGIQREKK